jgi:hypothetical protein
MPHDIKVLMIHVDWKRDVGEAVQGLTNANGVSVYYQYASSFCESDCSIMIHKRLS